MKVTKLLNRSSQVIAVASALASLVFFFFTFAVVTAGGKDVLLTAAQMSFKGTVASAAGKVAMARSADVLFCFLLSVLGLAFSILTFIKGKFVRYAAPAVALGTGIYMLVIACSRPVYFVDVRPLANVTAINYGFAVWAIMIALFAAFVFGVIHLLLNDYIEVSESKTAKYTIPKRFIRFIKDYKSELKKVVWPGPKSVAKNTLIVLVMCLLIGIVIWLIDFGLSQLLQVVF